MGRFNRRRLDAFKASGRERRGRGARVSGVREQQHRQELDCEQQFLDHHLSTATTAKTTAVASRTFHLALAGNEEIPPGAPKGSATVVLTLNVKTLQTCWGFSHLRGFTHPTFARIHRGVKKTAGPIIVPLSTGPTFRDNRCVPTSAAVMKPIEQKPTDYYVNIHSKQYPGGAVRSQL